MICIVNIDDLGYLDPGPSRFHAYEVSIGAFGTRCAVLAACEQDAIDVAVDFLTDHGLFAFGNDDLDEEDGDLCGYGNFGISIRDDDLHVALMKYSEYRVLAKTALLDALLPFQQDSLVAAALTALRDVPVLTAGVVQNIDILLPFTGGDAQALLALAARRDSGHDLRVPVPHPQDVIDTFYAQTAIRLPFHTVLGWSCWQRLEALRWALTPMGETIEADTPPDFLARYVAPKEDEDGE